MKFVKTFKAFDSRELEHAYEHVDKKKFNSITVAFAHGAVLNGARWEKARPCYQWKLVDDIPKAYILRGMTTPDKAYSFGKELIDACYKANKVPYDIMQEAYKTVYRLLKVANCKIYRDDLPNPTIVPEVTAEDECNAFIKNMRFVNKKYSTEMPEELLRFYCRAFQIDAPTWWVTAKPIAQTYTREDGSKATMYAICPEINSTYKQSYASDYAGNLDENGDKPATAPYTLLKDAKPQQLSYEDKATIIASVEYFLSLPIEEQKNFLADNFEYTESGELVEISPEEREERELAMVKEAIRLNTARLYAGITG